MIAANQHVEASKILKEVILNPSLPERMHPFFWHYLKKYVTTEEGINYYLLETTTISELCQTKGKQVLDIGCGFGLRTICLALLGARKATGIDLSSEMIGGFRALLEGLPPLDVSAENADFLLTDYAPNSFDVVIVVEAISHVRDMELLLNKIQLVLRPGGTLYIRDGNNDMFLTSRIRSRRRWKRAEYGPIPEAIRDFREIDKQCFFEARIKIISEAYPCLGDKELKLVARKTQGLYGDEIIKAVDEYTSTGRISLKASFPYRNPYTGEFTELGINPYALSNNLKKKGFRCKFMPPYLLHIGLPPRFPRWQADAFGLASPILKKCPTFALPLLCPFFTIVATKK